MIEPQKSPQSETLLVPQDRKSHKDTVFVLEFYNITHTIKREKIQEIIEFGKFQARQMKTSNT